jgi:RNA polymerase sigma factor (sigma-70 family)
MNTSTFSDKDLVLRILSGHPDLFAPLVERHIRAAHAIAYARLGNASDAEDAVQEAFLRAYEGLASLRDPAKFAAWLLTIARHEAARVAAKRSHALAPSDRHLDHTSNPSDSSSQSDWSDRSSSSTTQPDPAQREMNEILRGHVMRLPEPAREVLMLHYFAGHSAREIAALLDLRRAAVLKRLQRAREQLAETMLRDLEAARPTEASLTKQVAHIAALAATVGIPAAVATTTIATAATLLSVKALAGVTTLIVISAGAVIYTVSSRDSNGLTVQSTVSALPPPSKSKAAPEDTSSKDEATPPATLPATAPTPRLPEAVAVPASDVQAILSESLDGIWNATILKTISRSPQTKSNPPAAPSTAILATAELSFEQTETNIEIYGPKGTDRKMGRGSIANNRLRLKIALPILTSLGVPTLSAEGEFQPGANAIELRGTYVTGDHPYTFDTTDGPRTESPESLPVTVTLARVPAEELSMRDYIAQKNQDVEALRDAIRRYQKDHAGAYPLLLEYLVPVYLKSLEKYSKEAGATVQYNPPNHPLPNLDAFPYKLEQIIHRDSPYHPELALPDRLAAFEEDLKRFWGEDFMAKPLIVVSYDKYDLRMYLSLEGNVDYSNVSGAGSDAPALSPEMIRARQRASCANNLKQLGLSFKMFMNEMPGEYSPPGWMTAYLQYMPDRRILTCPGAQPATLSYQLIWPTATEAEFLQLYRDRVDPNATQSEANARVPVIIEINECEGSGGRNVLFLDGHVEFIKGPLDQNPRIKPFLNLKRP